MMNQKQPVYVLVEERADLCRISADLEKEMAIGVDLEADSMYHYQERVCLVQISTRFQNILVDPLALRDLSPLAPVFADPRVRKVFHGADYDIRSLHRDFGIEISSLFDTQIAARFLGIRETSLASLLKEMFGISIKKKYQKKDWSKRPLPSAMLDYAVQDASHLLPLAQILEEELMAKGRLFCVEEECEMLRKVRSAACDGHPLFTKFKGARRLDARSLAILEAILRLRDDVASRRDRPPFKVLGNATVMEIAEKKPVMESDLETIVGLGPKQIRALGPSLLKKTREALNLPEEALPVYPPKKTKKPVGFNVAKRVKALKAWREKRADRLGMDTALVCSNAQIQSLALAHPKAPKDLDGIDGMKNWQKQVFGREICALLKTMA